MDTSPSSPLALGQISLRERERGFLVGGTQVGKSTLADLLGCEFIDRYAARKARRLILDSKPRYRGEWEMSGLRARARYKRWDHGEVVRDSVMCDDPLDLQRAFAIAPTVIVQCDRRAGIPRLVAAAALFLEYSRRGLPQLLQVDETMDFYFPNGAPRGGDDAITRAVRAGAERGTATLICSQRTKGIPTEIMEMLTKLYLFMLDATGDVKRLQEMGAPARMRPPRRERDFLYWTKADRDHIYGPYRLDLGRRAA